MISEKLFIKIVYQSIQGEYKFKKLLSDCKNASDVFMGRFQGKNARNNIEGIFYLKTNDK